MATTVESKAIEKSTKEFGNFGTNISSGLIEEDYLRELKGVEGIKKLDEMRIGDPQIKMALSSVSNLVKGANWEIEPYSQEAKDLQLAEFTDFILFCDIERGWQVLMHEILTFLAFGFSVFEVIHKNVTGNPQFGNYTGIKTIAYRDPKSIEDWNVDIKTGELLSITQRSEGDLSNDVEIPAEFLLLFNIALEGANYASTTNSLLRPVYGNWYRKNQYLKIEAIGNEKHAVGVPIGKYPAQAQASEIEAFKKVLQRYSYHQKQSILIPEGYEVDVIQTNFDSTRIRDSIKAEDESISRAFLLNFLNLGQGSNGGAFALGQAQADFFLKNVQHVAKIIEDVFNSRLIPSLINMNFGEQAFYPTLKATGIEEFGVDFAQVMSTLISSGGLTMDDQLEAHIRRRLKLPEMVEREVSVERSEQDDDEEQAPPSPSGTSQAPNPATNDNEDGGETSEATLRDKPIGTITFADTPRQLINTGEEALAEVMVVNLDNMANKLIADITNRFKLLPDSRKQSATIKVKVGGTRQYKRELKNALGNLSKFAVNQARKDAGVSPIKFQDAPTIALGKFTEAEFKKLPPQVQQKILRLVEDLVTIQIADLEKAAKLQFSSSVDVTDDAAIIASDMRDKTNKVVAAAKNVAAGTTSSELVNFSRMEVFAEPEVDEKIGSFTFVNPSPVAAICQELAGRVFSKEDAESFRNWPPLHPNCKSIIVPNLVGTNQDKRAQSILQKGGKQSRLTVVTQEAEKSITLSNPTKFINMQAELEDGEEFLNIMFDRKMFSESDARLWLTKHNFETTEIERVDDFIFSRQMSIALFMRDTFREVSLTQGVIGILGVVNDEPRSGVDTSAMESVIPEDLDAMSLLQVSFDAKYWSSKDIKNFMRTVDLKESDKHQFGVKTYYMQSNSANFKDGSVKKRDVFDGLLIDQGELK